VSASRDGRTIQGDRRAQKDLESERASQSSDSRRASEDSIFQFVISSHQHVDGEGVMRERLQFISALAVVVMGVGYDAPKHDADFSQFDF
jgi:hypothetical protein